MMMLGFPCLTVENFYIVTCLRDSNKTKQYDSVRDSLISKCPFRLEVVHHYICCDNERHGFCSTVIPKVVAT